MANRCRKRLNRWCSRWRVRLQAWFSATLFLWLKEFSHKFINHRPAGLDAMPGQQLGDGFTGSPFLPQFDNDILPGYQILKTRPAMRLKLGDSLPDGIGVSDSRRRSRENARQLRRRCRRMTAGSAAEMSGIFAGHLPGHS